jgi:hypothetical protein
LVPAFGGNGPGSVLSATLNGQTLVPTILYAENDPGYSLIFEAAYVDARQGWREGTFAEPRPIRIFELAVTGDFFSGGLSLEQFQGRAAGTATGLGEIYSIGVYPVDLPTPLALLISGVLGLACGRRSAGPEQASRPTRRT